MSDSLVKIVARSIESDALNMGFQATPEDAENLARSALAAVEASGTHCVAPLVATDDMGVAGSNVGHILCGWDCEQIYSAMLSSRPTQESA